MYDDCDGDGDIEMQGQGDNMNSFGVVPTFRKTTITTENNKKVNPISRNGESLRNNLQPPPSLRPVAVGAGDSDTHRESPLGLSIGADVRGEPDCHRPTEGKGTGNVIAQSEPLQAKQDEWVTPRFGIGDGYQTQHQTPISRPITSAKQTVYSPLALRSTALPSCQDGIKQGDDYPSADLDLDDSPTADQESPHWRDRRDSSEVSEWKFNHNQEAFAEGRTAPNITSIDTVISLRQNLHTSDPICISKHDPTAAVKLTGGDGASYENNHPSSSCSSHCTAGSGESPSIQDLYHSFSPIFSPSASPSTRRSRPSVRTPTSSVSLRFRHAPYPLPLPLASPSPSSPKYTDSPSARRSGHLIDLSGSASGSSHSRHHSENSHSPHLQGGTGSPSAGSTIIPDYLNRSSRYRVNESSRRDIDFAVLDRILSPNPNHLNMFSPTYTPGSGSANGVETYPAKSVAPDSASASTSTSSTGVPPSTPTKPSTRLGSAPDSPSSQLGSPTGSMSQGNRRPRPEWPSPKPAHRQGAAAAQYQQSMAGSQPVSGPSTSPSPSPWTTLETPSILRVPLSANGKDTTPRYQAKRSPVPIHQQQHQRQSPSPTFHPAFSAPPLSARSKVPYSIPPNGTASGASSTATNGSGSRVHLVDVPRSHVIAVLNKRAPEFWSSPHSGDCRIYIPMRKNQRYSPPRQSATPTADPQSHLEFQPPVLPTLPAVCHPAQAPPNVLSECRMVLGGGTALGRRGSTPGPDEQAQVMVVYQLHRDYLITQSTLLRHLLSPPSLDRASSSSTSTRRSPPKHTVPQTRTANGRGAAAAAAAPGPRSPPTLKGARVVPTSPGEPVGVYLPLPDPNSFAVLCHWLYWGDVATLENTLSSPSITWQGIVKNVEYLSLDDNIKRVMGKWWRRWVKTDVGRGAASATAAAAEEDRDAASEDMNGSDDGHDRSGDEADIEGDGDAGDLDTLMTRL